MATVARRYPEAVASGHPLTTATAQDILASGGNAFDAAVAAGFASTITEPTLTGLGGGGFMLTHTASGDEVLFDFFVNAPGRGALHPPDANDLRPITVAFPGKDQIFCIGPAAAAVPGVLKGLLRVHQRLGRLPLRDVLAPAVHMARYGVAMNSLQAYTLRLLAPILTSTPESRKLFSPNGAPLREGELFFNRALADFLEALTADAHLDFYHGALATRIARQVQEAGGSLTHEDLDTYSVVERRPLKCGYHGVAISTNPPPAIGGYSISRALRHLAKQSLHAYAWSSPQHLTRLIDTLVQLPTFLPPTNGHPGPARQLSTRGTTHLTVADGEGNVASMTSSNGEGCGYVVPDTGIMLNNMMGEDDLHPQGFFSACPGTRIGSMMAPTLIKRDQQVTLALGSGGSKRIRSVILQAILNHVDYRFTLPEMIGAPRLHWEDARLQVEPGFPKEAVAFLEKTYPVNLWCQPDLYFGGIHAVIPGQAACGDHRRNGHGWVGT